MMGNKDLYRQFTHKLLIDELMKRDELIEKMREYNIKLEEENKVHSTHVNNLLKLNAELIKSIVALTYDNEELLASNENIEADYKEYIRKHEGD